jgi:hypothetical protein
VLGGSANFQIGGVFNNVGSIALDALAPATGLADTDQMAQLTAVGATTLTGGGVITLSNQALNVITGLAGAVLTNVNNTIEGAGSITGVQLINQVGGAIAADQALPLIIAAYGTVVNQGLLEATHGGTLKLGGNFDNTGGTILADAGRVVIGGATIVNGTIFATGAGAFVGLQGIDALIGGGLDGINILGPLNLTTNAQVTIEGAINNFGKLLIRTGRGQSNTELLIGAPGAILSGGGEIFLTAASSVISGVIADATLTNLNDQIKGSGLLGKGVLTLINGVKGTIAGAGPAGLIIDTGITQIENDGLITAIKGGQTLIKSLIKNDGVLESQGGTLISLNAVSGSGEGIVHGGTLAFASSFAQAVVFQGSGVLQLAQSQSYAGPVTGFSRKGATAFDLKDIGFTGPGEATYSGTRSGGLLTVTDGTHTAQIAMVGDYLNTTFVAAGDGHGGTLVSDHANAPSIPRFAAAAASLGAGAGGSVHTSPDLSNVHISVLARPAVVGA